MRDIIFMDVETGGLEPLNCALLEAGFVFCQDGHIVDAFMVKVRSEGRFVDPKALAVNNINLDKHDALAFTREQAAEEIRKSIDEWTATVHVHNGRVSPGGHNVDFDLGFLAQLVGPGYLQGWFTHRKIDTATVARFLMDAGLIPDTLSGSLPSLVKHFEIADSTPHRALEDALLTAELYRKMVGLIGVKR